ncbi:MAG: arginine deiminase family protein [Gemmatimonadota bacterium]
MIALTRLPAPSFATGCLVTFVERRPIDFDEALRQHAAYRGVLEAVGCRVVLLSALPELPDGVFTEDVGVALPEGLVLTRPGAPERRPEAAAMERDLTDPGGAAGVEVAVVGRVEAPATLDGGDVVRLGRRLLVGRSSRTDDAGVSALAALAEPLGYRVSGVEIGGVLHLESVCTALDDRTLLVDPGQVDPAGLGAPVIEIDPDEPLGANAARANGALVTTAAAPRTATRLRRAGYDVRTVAISEFEKAEGAATCLSLRIP